MLSKIFKTCRKLKLFSHSSKSGYKNQEKAIPYTSAQRGNNQASEIYALHPLPYPLYRIGQRTLHLGGRASLAGLTICNIRNPANLMTYLLTWMFSLQSSGYGGGVNTISTENDDNRARRGKYEMKACRKSKILSRPTLVNLCYVQFERIQLQVIKVELN